MIQDTFDLLATDKSGGGAVLVIIVMFILFGIGLYLYKSIPGKGE